MTDGPTPSLHAVLFDMDGLLVDTEPQWFAAEAATAAWLGRSWTPEDQHALLGTNLPYAAEYLVRVTGSSRSPAEVMRRLEDEMERQLHVGGATLRPGAQQLLTVLADEDVPVGLVTSSVRRHTELILDAVDQRGFRVVVTSDDVEHRKPHPQPYLTALHALGAPAARTVALEDSPPGVASAEAAGCVVVAVPSVLPIASAPRRHVVSSLEQVDVAQLRELVTRS